MTFVGRHPELAVLRERLAAARVGRGGLVLVAGEPGIGKSRLAREAAELARRRGLTVAWADCRETEGAPPYWPWTQALRALLRHAPADALPAEAAELGPLLDAGAAAASDADRFRLFDAASRFLDAMAACQPLLLVFDDLHRADGPSLRLLRFVTSGGADAPLLLGTYRDTEVGPGHALTELAGEEAAGDRFGLLRLRGLSLVETAELAERVAGPDSVVDLATVHERTDGNPFFLTEVLRGDGARTLPATVEAAIKARVRRLPPATRELLRLGSVLGREVDLRLLGMLAGRPAAQLEPVLEPAVAAGLVVPHHARVDAYRFVHVLVAEALYGELPAAGREALHDRLVDVLAQDRDVAASDLASHACRALGAPGGRDRAFAYATTAGDSARARLAYEDAARWYAAALDVGADDDRARFAVLLELGGAAGRAGLSSQTRGAFEEAWRLACRRGWDAGLAPVALGLGDVVVSAGQADAGLVRFLEQALARTDDETGRVRLLARVAVELYWSPDLPRARALAIEAVDAARRCDDERALAAALDARQFVLRGPGLLDERVRLGEELTALAARLGDEELELHARRLLVPDRLQRDAAAADAEIAALAALAEHSRRPLARWYVLMYRALRAAASGRYDAALALVDEVEALGRRLDAQPTPIYVLGQRYVVFRDQGRVGELEGDLREVCDRYPIFASTRAMLALLLAETGRGEEAGVLLDALAADRCAAMPTDSLWLATLALLAETAARLGQAGHAGVLHELLAPYAGQAVVQGVLCWYGAVDHYLGLAAAAAGRLDQADAHLAAALRLHETWSAVPFVAATQDAHAALLRRRGAIGDRERAGDLAAAAAAHARRIGMRRLEGAAPAGGLTEREREILERLAGGASNKEIARRLGISVHTVERHVANIYTKIGTRNRAEATAYALRTA